MHSNIEKQLQTLNDKNTEKVTQSVADYIVEYLRNYLKSDTEKLIALPSPCTEDAFQLGIRHTFDYFSIRKNPTNRDIEYLFNARASREFRDEVNKALKKFKYKLVEDFK